MANVDVSSEIIKKQIEDMKKTVVIIDGTRKVITQQYQQLSAQWNDAKSRELGSIVEESNSALINIEKVLLQGQKNLLNLLKDVLAYEEMFLSTEGSEGGHGSEGYSRHLSPEDTNARWKAEVNSINEQIENYREALLSRGVPDGAWLSTLLATHRSRMLEQAGHDLDVASGHGEESIHNGNAYPEPGDYTSFYNQLAQDFFTHCAQATNPNYDSASIDQWFVNCQRCVPTYEMLRRGENVTALPCESGFDYLSAYPESVWENPEIISCAGDGHEDIETAMEGWGDGARAQVTVMWTETEGHTFIAEQRGGQIHYIDPQSGDENYVGWMDSAQPGMTQFWRIDNLNTTEQINNCYREIE